MWGITFLGLAFYVAAVTYQGNLTNLGDDLIPVFSGFWPFLLMILIFGTLATKGPAASQEIFKALAWLVIVAIVLAHGSEFLKNFNNLTTKLKGVS